MALPTLDDYQGLITTMYRDKPRFMALCALIGQPLVDVQALLEAVRAGFDLDTAVGVQLDQVGQWVGRSRSLSVPLQGVYFSWNTVGQGWGEGVWKGPYDPADGLYSLPDDAYRTLLKAKIAANSWDGTIPGAYEVWSLLFGDSGPMVVIQDLQDMTMVVGVAGQSLDAVTRSILVHGYLPLKPAGVHIRYFAVPPGGGKLFAWNCDSDALGGWGVGKWPEKVFLNTDNA